MRLRSLGMPFEQIRRTLDDPNFDLREALRSHFVSAGQQLNALVAVRAKRARRTCRTTHPERGPPRRTNGGSFDDDRLPKTLHCRISIMIHQDPGAAHEFLTDVSGFPPAKSPPTRTVVPSTPRSRPETE